MTAVQQAPNQAVRTGPVEVFQIAPPTVKDDNDQFLNDLYRDGFAIARGVVSPEKAAECVDKAHQWLEGFNLGYKRDDPSTWRVANLPKHGKGGLYGAYSIAHTQWVWDLKTTPKYVELFERIWGTKELAVSFDGGYLGVPLPKEEIENQNKAWPHTDQSPHRQHLYCVQSLVNLLPNNKEDGGLWVLRGSPALFDQITKEFNLTETGNSRGDSMSFTEEHMQWFYDHGCEWVHPDLQPGDAVFWDSRCAHYGAASDSGKPRFAVYTCYKPAAQLTPEQKAKKQEAFTKGYVTSHDPITFSFKRESDADWNILFPYGKPNLDERQLRYAGMLDY